MSDLAGPSTCATRTTRWAQRNATGVLFADAEAAGSTPRGLALKERLHHKIVVDHLPLAYAIARHYWVPAYDLADLRQVAAVGLVKAVKRFDLGRYTPFVGFAYPYISGEVRRHLRDNEWVVRPPRSVQEHRQLVFAVESQHTQPTGRSLQVRDLARLTGLSPMAVSEAIALQTHLRPDSLDSIVQGTADRTLADEIGRKEVGYDSVDLSSTLRPAIDALSHREKQIIYLRFFEERSQAYIGSVLGVSQVHASRLLKATLGKLANALEGSFP